MNTERVRNDFDEIARLSDCDGVGSDRYDSFLLSLVPFCAVSVLDIGCGLGRLAVKLATHNREVTGVDLSPEMIARARKEVRGVEHLTFLCGDFLERNFTAQQFDFVISAAALHHMPETAAVPRMVELLRPGGRLVIHDVRSNAGRQDNRPPAGRGVSAGQIKPEKPNSAYAVAARREPRAGKD